MRQLAQRVTRKAARVWLLALTLWTLLVSTAHAAERTNRRVDVTIVGAEEGDAALEASLAELLAGAHLSAHFARVGSAPVRSGAETKPTSDDVLAFVRIDVGRKGVLSLRIVDPRRRRVLTRELPIPHGLDEIAREEASHIVVYTVEAIGRGEDIGEPEPPDEDEDEDEKPRPARPSPTSKARPGAPALELETVGAVRSYANIVPAVFGTGAALSLSTVRGGIRVGGELAFEQRSLIVVTTQPVAARFGQRSVHLSVLGEIPVADGVIFRTSVGAALDLVDVSTTPLRPTSEPRRREFVDVIPVLDVAGGLRFDLAPRLAVIATAGLELPLSTSDYVVEDGRGRDLVLLSPHALRLVGRLAVAVRF